MHRFANVVIAATDDAYIDRLVNHLADNNYNVLVYDSPDDVIEETRKSQPDILFIDSEAQDFNGIQLAADISSGRMFSDIPMVLLGEGDRGSFYRHALDINADDAFVRDSEFDALNFRLRPLLRLATMRAELKRRRQLALAMGYTAFEQETNDQAAPIRLLYHRINGPQLEAIGAAAPQGTELVCAADPFEAEEMLVNQQFDAVVLGADEAPEATLSLCIHIRNNPRLFNLPVIVISDADRFDSPVTPYRKGATWCLSSSFEMSELRFAVNTLIRRQRMRWKIRSAIDATLAGPALDVKTNLYTFDYLNKHIKNLIESADAWRKHLTVVFFTVPTLPIFRQRFGDDAADHLHRQLGQWIKNLVRVEDLVACYGEKDFCVTLPDTPIEEAQIVMQRIAGIISYTDFAVNEVYQPISVTVEFGIADYVPNDTVDQLIARARANLE